ncbi:hypothetical protein CDAR_453001 [Caerostris darwini]|uniref:Uncharacterized protein n=1 Tax=Caerostris darwini TaxID=1538125 RepID=A0AAV4VDH6_9ARAC|nr:hypothetical protein CDAR_453001 [Caerostris darwini]
MVPGGGLTYWKQALTGTKGPSRVLWCLGGIAAAIVHWYCKPSGRSDLFLNLPWGQRETGFGSERGRSHLSELRATE